jgi:hypothetical protein
MAHMNVDRLKKILELIAIEPAVQQDVRDNYWENRWWPLSITDWRLRILLAGISTRVSYGQIEIYQQVRDQLAEAGVRALRTMDKQEYIEIVKPLGHADNRWKLWQAILKFADRFPDTEEEPGALKKLTSDELIRFLKEEIEGVGYRVAECGTLYLRGYHCGIIQVDTGMKDILGPCLGFETNLHSTGYEVMRQQIEELVQQLDFKHLLTTTGYEDILAEMQEGQINTWWVHLVLIYFKRRFCSFGDSSRCPMAKDYQFSDDMLFTCDQMDMLPVE